MPKNTSTYVDGYLLVVPKKKVAAYKKMAREGAKLWLKYGALSFKECRGDDVRPDMGGFKILQFPTLMKVKPSETVWFSYIEYKSKADRNRINKKVADEMSKMHKDDPNPIKSMPFDMKRMSFGGFIVEVSS
jgi:uncharacterized protein YbaA (DUF1428 family)